MKWNNSMENIRALTMVMEDRKGEAEEEKEGER
jgi:hypothetical protein